MVVRAGPVLLLSTVAHGVLVAVVAEWTMREPARPTLARVVAVAQPETPGPAAPIEVAFLVDEPVPAITTPTALPHATRSGAGSSRGGSSRGATAAITTTTTPGSESSTTPGEAPAPASGLLRMRGPDLSLDAGTAQRIASAGAAPARDEVYKSGKLQNRPGGGKVVYDRVTTMTVDPDGKAHFDDVPDIDLKFHLPIPKIWEVENMRRDLGHELTEWFKDPEAGKRYGRTQDLPRHLQASPGACDSWGSTMCDDPLAPQIEQRVRERKKVNGGLFGGMADITAYLHRKYVGDPYASRKLKLLDDTRDERVAMGSAYRAQQQARSGEFMHRNLERLWASEQQAIARRAALFELWDECGEDEAGMRARAVVIGWIRAKLPAGSTDAYTDVELEALQARRTSAAPFTPYAD
jgi:hypothetical protein